MYQNVLLDLDDTLFDFKASEEIALAQSLRAFGIEPTEAVRRRYSEINISLWKRLELKTITREVLLYHRFELLLEELGIVADAKAIQKSYEYNLSLGHIFLPGAEQLLKDLSPTHDLYMVTNGTALVQQGRIKSSGIAPYFKGIFISQEVGYDKPDKRYFDACFAAMKNVNRDTTIIVGDSISSDMRGGENAGIATCWFNPKGLPRPADIRIDYEIQSLEELYAIVQ